MAVPKKKTSKSRKGMRRMHLKLDGQSSVKCTNCSEPVRPHTICSSCGHYKGVKRVKTAE